MVADGTPAELKQRGNAVVRVVIRGAAGGGIRSEIEKINGVHQVEPINSGDDQFSGRVLVTKGRKPGDIARDIYGLASSQRWQLEELHQDEGKLDEVFRSITRSETAV